MKPKLLLLLCVFCIGLAVRAQKKLDVTKNIKYATNVLNWKNRRIDSLMLDIYYPPEAMSNKKYPLIVYCHGGGFMSGTREDVASDADMLRKQGFAVAAIDYRVGYAKDRTKTECDADTLSLMMAIYRAMQDVNAALRFINANAATYYINPNKIFLAGTSAGGTLTLFDTYINDSIAQIYYPYCYNVLGSLQTSGNTLPNNYNIRAIAPMWGGMPDLGLITHKTAKPTILFKGGLDPNLPDGSGHFQQCENYPNYLAGIGIYNATKEARKPCVYHFNPLGVHAAYDDLFCAENIACFFNAIIAAKPYNGFFQYYESSCQ